ncbi:PGF-CTERM archaeal protein-sorting signal [Halolamina pelagica]|uniref:PGF-CTERM archaeal protein-sorting signal n=1 Tax=Halolamina pelagica TaxID=699431 RepID=A0A0P7FX98_9EURY|nr:PGF-CTERM sorting domain-containing protein [Halolamina pelagica]KPN31852.1 PGF-CTERM archaeal protein-sorting signal [Halolamina pelagica]
MDNERALLGGAAVVVVAALLTAAVVPGAVAPPDDDPVRPGPVRVVDADIATGEITGQTAELDLFATLEHRGNPAKNVTVRFEATDAESGLLVAEDVVTAGDLTADRERRVSTTLTVPREGGYELTGVVYRNGTRVDEFSRRVSGVGALTPPYAESNVSFVDDPVLEPVTVSIVDASEERTTLELGGWLTAVGPSEADSLSVTFVVRQAESNVVAARTSVDAGGLGEGRSETVTTEVSVPSEYNYYVDAILTRDGVIVDTAGGVVNLDPTETIDRDERRQEVEFNASDFDRDGRRPDQATETGETAAQTPGFGPAVAVIALLGAGLLARRRR